MYDPTIFENLKVAIENQVYDLDNLDHMISITNRVDRMDFAVMAREFSIEFHLVGRETVRAEIVLKASLDDLAGEILEIPGKNLGCLLSLRFLTDIQNPNSQCKQIEQMLHEIWEDEIQLTQTLSFVYGNITSDFSNLIEMKFKQKINEENMGEISDFLENVLITLEKIN